MKGIVMLRVLQRSFACLFVLIPCMGLASEKMTFGRFNSRAIFNQSDVANCSAPLVILVPGSGANGPEEMIPASMAGDGQEHSIFDAFAEGLRRSHVGTLAIGKPGVDFHRSWDVKDIFYDRALYQGLKWQDMIDNLKDAVDFAKTLPCVDAKRIVILGHSEGTQLAVDFSSLNPDALRALMLVGFAGENLETILDWQLFRRPIDSWLSPDVDTDKDGYISKSEAAAWPEFEWNWLPGQDRVSFAEIEQTLRGNVDLQKEFQKAKAASVWKGVFDRVPIYDEAASLPLDIYVYTGALDVQTRPEEAMKLKAACESHKKINCEIQLVPGLGHGMSEPKGPRKQKLIDSTLAPVSESFLEILARTAARLF
jgi:pimeloyl-ACP methyl ester carboxylesterase